jgi:hypothetical protein
MHHTSRGKLSKGSLNHHASLGVVWIEAIEVMTTQELQQQGFFRERECVHRAQGAEGDFYRGTTYVKSLQRLGSSAAMRVAGNVTAFFWSDAPHVAVWLCRDCAAELGMRNQTSGATP